MTADALCGERPFDDLARVDRGAIDRAAEQLLVANQPMARVEEQAAKNLVRQIEQLGLKEPGRVSWCRERRTRLHGRAEVAAAELERCEQARHPSGP